MEHHRQWAKDLCPDYLTPEAVQCMRENLKIITAKDFLSTSTPKIARTCGFEEEKVEHAKEAIYNLYSVNVLNCGEWFMETKRLNEKVTKPDLPERVRKWTNRNALHLPFRN